MRRLVGTHGATKSKVVLYMQKITARDITKALAKRHKEDMFFTEVKNGPNNRGGIQ